MARRMKSDGYSSADHQGIEIEAMQPTLTALNLLPLQSKTKQVLANTVRIIRLLFLGAGRRK
jgi:hypothetical protein